MLFVSLLRGFGLFPGRSASPQPVEETALLQAQSPAEKTLVHQERLSSTEPTSRRETLKKNADKATKPTQPKAVVSKGAVVAEAPSVQGAAEKAVAVKKATKAKPPSLPLAQPEPAPTVAVKKPAKAAAATKKAAPVKTEPVPVVSQPEPVALAPAAPVVVAPAKRGRRAAAQPVPTPQPEPSHSPDAAKATFSHFPERVMNFPVHSPARKDPQLANNWKNKPVELLTDAEVLSMPDDEYMNETQTAFFRHKLVRLKKEILSNAGETTEHLREDTVVVPDPADRATIEEEHALELRTRDRERKLLKKIEQSIARIDAGDYGYCDETGEPIGVGRLIARPTASLSLEAQQRRELKQKMFGD